MKALTRQSFSSEAIAISSQLPPHRRIAGQTDGVATIYAPVLASYAKAGKKF
jgi:hypothetical protein